MAEITLATAADYADAMITARRAKNWLFLLLLLVLLIQIGVFFATRYSDVIIARSVTVPATTQSSDARDKLKYVIGVTDFLGIALAIVLSAVLLLAAQIMLVARLIGVGRLTSAFIWSLVLVVLLFPWQAFLDPFVFKLPGVLYTWDELLSSARFSTGSFEESVLRWSRFVALPVVALILLLLIQVKSTRGVRMALGEGVVRANDRASDA
jgi:hypothetical protein